LGILTKRLEDVQAIVDLCKKVLFLGESILGRKANVNIGVSTFIPKPHTPFQWVPQDSNEQILAKQKLLKDQIMPFKGLHLRWNDIEGTRFEGWLSRGDRRLADVIERAWALGCTFDAWQDHHYHDLWLQAFEEIGLDPEFYISRERDIEEIFPWEHIDIGVHKRFLKEDYLMSKQRETRVDCRDNCFACGILPKFSKTRAQTEALQWECPPVTPVHERGKRNSNVTLIEG
jgi:hypothetical protein